MISNTLMTIINSCSKIALAVSGGSDSMAMLHWFINNIDITKFYVINIEHGIRGDESLNDSAFVCEYCKKWGVNCLSESVDSPKYAAKHKMPLEQAARVLRHEIFKQEATTTADYIALAHHKLDQAESIFMHIARGCGINGLCGMSEIDGYILRPLLNVDKDKIMQYLLDNSVPHVHDSSNMDNSYNRNFIRNTIVPTIEKSYPQFSTNVVKLGQKANEAMELIHSLLPQLESIDGTCIINIAPLHTVVAKVAIQRAASLIGVAVDIEEKHLNACLALIARTNGSRLMLPHGLRAYNENGLLALTVNTEIDNSSYAFDIATFNFAYGEYIITPASSDCPVAALIDSDKMPHDVCVRTYRAGDKIKLSYGAKSLGDYYTDKKVPKRLRGCLPILAHGADVIAVCDWAVGIEYAPCCNTKNYIQINYIQKDKIYG